MAAAKRGLNMERGISALIPVSDYPGSESPVDVFFPRESTSATPRGGSGPRFAEIRVDDVVPNPQQPRKEFDEEALKDLVDSVRENGVVQPIVVRPSAADPNKFELVMGERRLRASRLAQRSTIPAVIRDTADASMLQDALLENLHRAELNPLEEASAYQQLIEDFGITQEVLAERIGRSRPQVTNTIRLLKLPDGVKNRVASGVLTAGHAKAILALSNSEDMQRLADRVVNEELSVRATEAAAARGVNPAKAKAAAGKRHEQLDEVANRLGDRLNTRVKVTLGASKGQIVIDFATIADLNRILADIGDDASAQ